MMFSQDWPYQSCGEKGARTFLAQASISQAEQEAIAHGNWERLISGIWRNTPTETGGSESYD